jgi:hypothetical protein
MNRNEAGALVLVVMLAGLALPAASQTPAPGAASAMAGTPSTPASSPSPTPSADAQPTSRAQGDASRDADPRHCLDFPTNLEIIACAERYRSHRARK